MFLLLQLMAPSWMPRRRQGYTRRFVVVKKKQESVRLHTFINADFIFKHVASKNNPVVNSQK